jgi:hypothetical protein
MASEREHFNAARSYQAHYDEVLRQVGMRAPAPVLGQTVNEYRRETLRTVKKAFLPSNHELYKVQFRGLPADALKGFEPQLLAAAVVEANNPNHVAPGEFRQVQELDALGQVRSIRFVGPESFVKQMGRPGRRVVSFRVPEDPSGRTSRREMP